ncbi:MAG: biotin--[acetyl-CoA-carboxylase] ligase [Variovorax sp.]|jgi:BirA family biotin operon repressor/biotin-[acetyl-CoA-carboxylase] ligase|nr:MAG: biotin--[acetyl-CoA-carboxylase] ligase [Variovorax sp.]
MAGAWSVPELSAALAPLLPGLRVEVVAEIDSTNTELMRRARAGDTAPVLLVAERQTAGRGRLGRAWCIQGVEPGTQAASLMFSLGLPFAPRDWSGLSLAVGASVADGLDPGGTAGVRLKWPNDLWMADDRKLAGILIETASPVAGHGTGAGAPRQLVIGIGINIGPRDAQGLRAPPAWVREWRPDATAADVLRDIAAPLLRDVLAFGHQGLAPFAERFAARDALQGREVDLSDGTTGWCEGIGWGGELRVRTAAGLQSIVSSDISVRPRRAGE